MLKRLSVILAIAVCTLFARVTPAFAHATLLRSEPKPHSRLMEQPSRVWLLFSEEMEPAMARLTLNKPDGSSVVLPATGDPHDVSAIMANLDRLGPGTYTVQWHVVSADGHPVNGTLTFTIDASVPPVAAPPVTAGPVAAAPVVAARADSVPVTAPVATWGPSVAEAPVIPSILRGAAMFVTMALFGFLVLMSGTPAGSAEQRAAFPLVTTLALVSPLLLAAHAIAWLLNASVDHTISMTIAESAMLRGTGRMEAWRVGLSLLVPIALLLGRRPRIALLFSAAVLVISGGSGHAAAIHPEFAIPAKALHLLAGGSWIGGVLWLIASVRSERSVLLVQANRVSSLALASVVVVLLTGVVQTWLFVPNLGAFFGSAYGYVDLAKIVLLGVLILFGVHHRRRGLPLLPDPAHGVDGFHAVLRRELAVMVCVVLLGGLLAYLPPPPL